MNSVRLGLFSYSLIYTYILGTQKNHLIEMVLLSIHNICFDWRPVGWLSRVRISE